MTRALARIWLWLLFICLVVPVGYVHGHETAIAVLSLHELDAGQFMVRWSPTQGINSLEDLKPRFPDQCQLKPPLLDCRDGGLVGTVGFDGLSASRAAVIHMTWRDGSKRTYTLTGAQPEVIFAGDSRSDARGKLQIARAYLAIGIEHILLGVDHLLFVLGLVWIVGSAWMLVKTITAFTVAHSLTLAAATFGWVGVPERAVNAIIALSIVFVGVEVIKGQRGEGGLTVRCPWLVAFAFGLLHGFGFANALTQLGLPPANLPLALLFFNVGVEVGQIAFVLLVLALQRCHQRLQVHLPPWSQPVPAYAIGSIAMFWFIHRLSLFLPG